MYFKKNIYLIMAVFVISLFFLPNYDHSTNQLSSILESDLQDNYEEESSHELKKLLIFTEKPWGNDPRFKEAIVHNGTYELMAEYQATLKEPLPGEMYNVKHAAQMLAGTVLEPGEVFSQNKKLGPYISSKGYQSGPMYKGTKVVEATGGGVCKIASLLYNVTILSNLQIIERYNHSMTVPYVPLGQDATVYYGVKDFRFKNTTKGPLLIWAQTVDNTLYMAIYGQEKPPKVTWHHENLKHIKYWNIYRTNSQLPKGTQKIIIPGQDGYVVSTSITIEYPDGRKETKKMGKDYYNPLPQLIERGF